MQILNILQIITPIVLVILILLQERSAGAGGLFGGGGGGGGFYQQRRGIEKTLFTATIVTGAIFVIVSILNLVF